MSDLSQLVQSFLDADSDARQPFECHGIGLRRLGERDLDPKGDQVLLHTVVKVLLHLPALGVARAHEPRARLA